MCEVRENRKPSNGDEYVFAMLALSEYSEGDQGEGVLSILISLREDKKDGSKRLPASVPLCL